MITCEYWYAWIRARKISTRENVHAKKLKTVEKTREKTKEQYITCKA